MTRALACGVLALLACLAVRTQAPDDLDALDQAKQGLYVVDAYHHGRWLVPMEAGRIYPTKPPLMTWLSLAVAAPRGRVDELAARWPSVAAALLLVAATVRFARRLGPAVALTAAIAIGSSFHVTSCGWLARTDMLLAAATTFAVAQAFECVLVARSGADPRRSFLALAALAGLGTVCKSPVALACPAFTLGFFLIATDELAAFARAVGLRTFALGALVYGAIVAVWLVPATLEAGEPFLRTLWDELRGHALGDGAYASKDKIKPFYYPLFYFLGSFQPWSSVFVLGALRSLPPRPRDERTLAAWFAACAVLGSLAFFSLLRIKRVDHVLPIYPWASVCVGLAVERWHAPVRHGFSILAILAMAASVLLPVALLIPGEHAHHPVALSAAALALAPAGVLVLLGARRRALGPLLAGTALIVTASLGAYYFAFREAVQAKKAETVPPFCEAARGLAAREPLTLYRVPPSVAFYLERSQDTALALDEAAADMARRGARAVVTDELGARELLARDRTLALARTSGFYRKSGHTWQLALLLPRERVPEPADPSGGAARLWW